MEENRNEQESYKLTLFGEMMHDYEGVDETEKKVNMFNDIFDGQGNVFSVFRSVQSREMRKAKNCFNNEKYIDSINVLKVRYM